jgi:hypothetical protein
MIICDNFLPVNINEEIKKIILCDYFPWYFNDFVVSQGNNELFQFTHTFFREGKITSDYFNSIKPILSFTEEKFGFKVTNILRVKANLLTPQSPIIDESAHVDCDIDGYKSILFYVNDSDGDTLFLSYGDKISPKENRIVVFDSNLIHSSTPPLKNKRRVVINFVVKTICNKDIKL